MRFKKLKILHLGILFERKHINLPFPNMEMNKQGKKKQTNKQMKEWRGGGEKGK
jgi:small-conductance mechanosensitive channel